MPICDKCGTNNDVESVFCGKCGHRLQAAEAPRSQSQPSEPIDSGAVSNEYKDKDDTLKDKFTGQSFGSVSTQVFPLHGIGLVVALVLLSVFAIVIGIFSLAVGPLSLSFVETLEALFGIGNEWTVHFVQDWRLPALLIVIIAGICFGLTTVVMSDIFSKDYMEPSVTGVSSVAVLATTIAITNGFDSTGRYVIALLIALIYTILQLLLMRKGVSQKGLLIGSFGISLVAIVLSVLMFDFTKEKDIVQNLFLIIGDSSATWDEVTVALITIVICSVLLFLTAFALNKDRNSIMGTIPIFASAAICSVMVGVVSSQAFLMLFLGLAAYLISKRIVSGGYRTLMPTVIVVGALLGAFAHLIRLILLADYIKIGDYTITDGIITAVIGVLVLIVVFLLDKKSNRSV